MAALATAIAIFIIAIILPKFLDVSPAHRILTTQALELGLSLVAIAVLGKGKFAEYGFRRPLTEGNNSGRRLPWLIICLTAPLLGIVASAAIVTLGGNGNPVVRQLTLPQIVLFVWVFSSVIEEIFTRGFLQGHLSDLSGKKVKLLFFHLEVPALISGLFFACMHLSLPFIGADATTTIIIFLFTLSIGFMAGHFRETSGSLYPAIAVHVLANIGGMIGGIIAAVIRVMMGGSLPGA